MYTLNRNKGVREGHLSPTDRRQPLRLWPGFLIVGLQWAGRYGLPLFAPELLPYGALGGLVGGLGVVLWWAFLSRAPFAERVAAIALMSAALVVTPKILHVSLATAGMGFLFYLYAVPLMSLAFVLWAAASRGLSKSARFVTMTATIAAACGVFALLRTGGITGSAESDFAWRWSETAEERLIAESDELPAAALPPEAALEADWPGFRGPGRDSVIQGFRIETDWTAKPPVELWRRPVGPGWSSFSVAGDYIYTQEQRGEEEIVACYDARTGEALWHHSDEARFYESNGGPGPRGTPTLHDGSIYAFGATGILNALDARDGTVLWSRNVSADAERKVPGWGFASSPLVLEDAVFVAAAGKLAAYDRATGEPRWVGPDGGAGYSSPHRVTIDGVEQVILMSVAGAASFDPVTGARLWEHPWKGGARIVQPAQVDEGDFLLSEGEGRGIRRVVVTRGEDGFEVAARWTSIRLKPYFNDFVVHEGHAYGFDGSILTCMDIENGERVWKGGRYGHGQLLLLTEQDLLLVVTEEGELALVRATPDRFTELARVPALNGKTWNHPVLIGDRLFVRNGEEMAAFRLAVPST